MVSSKILGQADLLAELEQLSIRDMDDVIIHGINKQDEDKNKLSIEHITQQLTEKENSVKAKIAGKHSSDSYFSRTTLFPHQNMEDGNKAKEQEKAGSGSKKHKKG